MAQEKAAEAPATVGSANVFVDLGFADSDVRLAKADLAVNIKSEIRRRGLTLAQVVRAGRGAGITTVTVDKLKRRMRTCSTKPFSKTRPRHIPERRAR